MRKFEEFIKTKSRQLPNDNIAETQSEILELMEDKYENLVESGIETEVAIDMVISDFKDFGEIYDELDNKDIRSKYEELMSTYNKKTFKTILGMFLTPQLILISIAVIAHLTNNRLVFVFGLVAVAISIMFFIYIMVQRELLKNKYEKILETKSDTELKNTKFIITGFTIAAMILIGSIVPDSVLIIGSK